MYCYDCREDSSNFDDASCESEQSSCKSVCVEDECKCTELQNPVIMQYFPARVDKPAVSNKPKTNALLAATVVNGKPHVHETQYDREDRDFEEDTDRFRNGTADFSKLSLSEGLSKTVGKVQLSVILIGDSNTGKTSLVARFADDKLVENYETTIGIDFSIAQFRLNGTFVRLQLWDTAGQEKFNAITTQYYHKAMGVVFVYDVTKLSTFVSIPKWNRAVEQHAEPDVVKLLCGNKMDLDEERKVSTEQGRKLAHQLGARFCEVSALETTNVFEAFSLFSRDVFREYYAKRNPCASPSAVRLNPVPTVDNKGCCGS